MNTIIKCLLFLVTINIFVYQLKAQNHFYYIDSLNGEQLNLLSPAFRFDNTIVCLNGSKGRFLTFYNLDKGTTAEYDFYSIKDSNHLAPLNLFDVVRNNKGDYFLGTDVGVFKFDGNSFIFLKGINDQATRIFMFHDTLYAIGSFQYLKMFIGNEFVDIVPDSTNGGNLGGTYDWWFSVTRQCAIYHNKCYFTTAKNSLSYYDLITKTFHKSSFNKFDSTSSLFLGSSSINIFDDKIYLIGYNDKGIPSIIIFDEDSPESTIVDSSIHKAVSDTIDYYDIYNFQIDQSGNQMFNLDCKKGIGGYLTNVFIDKDGNLTDLGELKPSPTNGTKLGFHNLISFPDGRDFYSLLSGGFLVYDPNGIGDVEQTDEVSTIMVYKAYPNPVKNRIKILFANWTKKVDEIRTELYDYLGQRIAILKPEDIDIDPVYGYGTMQLDLSGVPNGAYYLVIKNNVDMRVVPVIKE